MENYIGENIRYYRERLGISQAELARRLGKTGSAVSQYESGINVPRVQVVEKMADIFGCRASDILDPFIGIDEGTLLPYDATMDEIALIEMYRAMSPEKQQQLVRIARSL